MIMEETNQYTEQCLLETNKQWSTNAKEICVYMGFMILMGINRFPEIGDYLCTDKNLRYALITDRISQDRFEEIMRYLHFADDKLPARGKDDFSRLQVDPVISALKQRFKSAYYPHSQLSVDKAMIPFKGQSSMKQYLPLKPVKHGFKVWDIADALNGYLYDFNLHWCYGRERNSNWGEGGTYIVEGEAPPAVLRQLFHLNHFAGQTSSTGHLRLWHDPDKQKECPI